MHPTIFPHFKIEQEIGESVQSSCALLVVLNELDKARTLPVSCAYKGVQLFVHKDALRPLLIHLPLTHFIFQTIIVSLFN